MNINRIKRNQEQTQFLNTPKYNNNKNQQFFNFFYEPKYKMGKNFHFFGVGFCFLIIFITKAIKVKIFEEESLVSLFIINDLG